MKQSAESIYFLKWFVITTSLGLLLSLKFSPPQILVTLAMFSGFIFFVLLTWKNLSNGILIWISSFIIFAQANVIRFASLPNFPVERIIWAIIVLMFLVQIYCKKLVLLRMTKIEYSMLIFLIICVFSIIYTKGVLFGKGQGFRDFLNGFAIPFFSYFISKNVFDDVKKVNRLLCLLCFISVYLIIAFVLGKLNLDHLLPHFYFAKSGEILFPGRFVGPFGNPAVCGAVLGMFIHSAMYYQTLLSGSKQLLVRIFIFVGPAVIFFTYTRSAWLGFFASTVLFLILYRNLRPFLMVLLASMLLVVLLNLPNVLSDNRTKGGLLVSRTVDTRLNLYYAYKEMVKEKPFLGQGFGETTQKDIAIDGEETSSHNSFLSVLVELGIVGFCFYISIFGFLFHMSLKIYKSKDGWIAKRKDFIILFWAIGLNYLINAILIEMRFFLLPNSLIFVVAGTIGREYQKRIL